MSLTTGRGPLSPNPAGRFVDGAYVEPLTRRVRARKGGAWVVDTTGALLVHRPDRPPAYALPAADVRIDALPVPEAPGYVSVAWDSVDEWWEEAARMGGHPRNPYHRVDCLPTQRTLRVASGGELLAECDGPIALFETSLPPRLYVPKDAVRTGRLHPSGTTTYCPYKGTASYWSTDEVADVAWSYEAPFPECSPIAGMLSFYEDRCDLVIRPPFEEPRSPR